MDNTNKNPIFSIKNFRSFGEDGADFELAPITVLTGCNSAGKSSLVKALMLLSEIPHTKDYIETSLKLYKKEFGLGSLKNVLNKSSQNKILDFSYKAWSNHLQEDVIVQRTFFGYKNDELNDARLDNLIVHKTDGQIIFNQDDSITSWRNELEWSKILEKEYSNFRLVSEYLSLLKLILFINKDEFIVQYEECTRKIATIKDALTQNGINPKKYKIRQLLDWISWINTRTKEMEEWLKYAEDERQKEAIIKDHFPEEDIAKEFLSRTINEVVSPWFLDNAIYIDSASAIIKRIYSIEDTSKMSIGLRNLYSHLQFQHEHGDWLADDPSSFWAGSFLNRWIKKFEIGDKIALHGDSEGGLKVYLRKNEEERLLADEGYGITQLVSLLLSIDNSISSNSNEEFEELWEEYEQGDFKKGKVIQFPFKPRVICVEEPEVHLHPKYQSLLAEMFVEAYQKYNIHFIIETHSEYLIRKLQVMVADIENALTSDDVSLNYVEKNEEGISHNRQIKIKEDGRLDGSFGEGFYDEAGNLSRIILKMSD